MSTNTALAGTKVAVMGAGAVGSYFGGMLARAGAEVTLIGRPAHMEAIRKHGLHMETVTFQERVQVKTATDASGAKNAEFVLFCVKTLSNEEASRELAKHLTPGAVVVSLQNGVDNVERMRAAAGLDVLPAVVYVAAALTEPGRVKHNGRGDLIVGELAAEGGATADASSERAKSAEEAFGVPGGAPNAKQTAATDAAVLHGMNPGSSVPRTERVAKLFGLAGVPCAVSKNIEGDLWTKLIMNCAGNAVSALGRSSYGRAVREPKTREVMSRVIEETVGVARAVGVNLPPGNLVEAGLKLAETLGEATSSTAQDIARGRRTEMASLNGYVVRRGAEKGVPTPVNATLDGLVALLELTSACAVKRTKAGHGRGGKRHRK